jgi:hypothetical protein
MLSACRCAWCVPPDPLINRALYLIIASVYGILVWLHKSGDHDAAIHFITCGERRRVFTLVG